MTQDDIIRIAQEAGFGDRIYEEHEYELACFAALVAAAEREACAKLLRRLGTRTDIDQTRRIRRLRQAIPHQQQPALPRRHHREGIDMNQKEKDIAELDMLVAELDYENRLLRARNERLEKELAEQHLAEQCRCGKQTNAWCMANTCSKAEQSAQQQAPEYKGWYCAHCQRGVDGSEVTYHEQHTVCGRVITDDVPPKAQQQDPVACREDIIRMAREAGFDPHDMSADFTCNFKDIERFAQLVRAAALEEAAEACENTLAQHYMKQVIPTHDEALLLAACADCAAAILALKEKT